MVAPLTFPDITEFQPFNCFTAKPSDTLRATLGNGVLASLRVVSWPMELTRVCLDETPLNHSCEVTVRLFSVVTAWFVKDVKASCGVLWCLDWRGGFSIAGQKSGLLEPRSFATSATSFLASSTTESCRRCPGVAELHCTTRHSTKFEM